MNRGRVRRNHFNPRVATSSKSEKGFEGIDVIFAFAEDFHSQDLHAMFCPTVACFTFTPSVKLQPLGPCTILVTVKDVRGTPIADALVTVDEKTQIVSELTDQTGTAFFNRATCGNYDVRSRN